MFIFLASNKVKNRISVLEAKSAMDCLTILQDEKLFTQTDVIFMQFLCRETDCLNLYAKCIEYAEKQKALCFFEKQSGNFSVNNVEYLISVKYTFILLIGICLISSKGNAILIFKNYCTFQYI